VNVNLPARWEGAVERGEAQLTSLSFTGCFLLSGGDVTPKELLRLEIIMPDQDPLYAWAEVVDHAYDIGFAVQFTLIEDQDQVRLAEFILQCG
jgi:hypothetical protein